MAMNIAGFGKPRLPRPLMRRHRLIVENCLDIIDGDVLGVGKILRRAG
jgi:hypothetical protein